MAFHLCESTLELLRLSRGSSELGLGGVLCAHLELRLAASAALLTVGRGRLALQLLVALARLLQLRLEARHLRGLRLQPRVLCSQLRLAHARGALPLLLLLLVLLLLVVLVVLAACDRPSCYPAAVLPCYCCPAAVWPALPACLPLPVLPLCAPLLPVCLCSPAPCVYLPVPLLPLML